MCPNVIANLLKGISNLIDNDKLIILASNVNFGELGRR